MSLNAQIPTGNRPGGFGGNAAQFNIGRFYGKVVDETTGKGLAYASVQLHGMRWDSTTKSMQKAILAGQLTLENGDFSLENLPIRGEMTLRINYLGYAETEMKVSFGDLGGRLNGGSRPNGGNPGAMAGAVDKDLGNIKLAATSSLLKEVTIEGSASQMSLALDKKVYRVDKDNVAAGGTAEDALKNIPTLNVDIDGNLTLRSAAPQIFVDGRPTNLTLDQIPADAIDNVEVITNPSAKYDASGGGSGIVNIVLKKERRIGYNGSVRTGIDMRGRANLGGDINAREGKVNAFIGLNLNQRRNLSAAGTDRFNFDLENTPTSDIFQTNAPVNNGFFAMGRAGLDWFINNRNTLTISGNIHGGSFKAEDQLNRLEKFYLDTLPDYDVQSTRFSNTDRQFRNIGSQLLYKYLFPKEGKEWTADLNYNTSVSDNNGDFRTEYLGSSTPSLEQQKGDGGNQFVTFQTDFVNPISKTQKIELGARAAIRDFNSNNASYVFDPTQNQFIYVPGFTDKYKFKDQVYAAYGTYSQSFQKWGYQLGLRAESSTYTGTLIDRDTSFRNDFPFSLFPSAFVTYKLNENDNMQMSFTRRINRPNFFQLVPFTDFSDSLNISRGNPDLIPEFAHAVELSYQNILNKNHNFLVSAYFKRSNDLITRYTYAEVDPATNRTIGVNTYENANSSTAYGLEFTIKNTFWKILELTSNVNAYNSVLDLTSSEGELSAEQFTWFVKENLSLKLPKSFTVQLNGSYQSRTAFDTGGGRGGGGYGGGPSSTAQGYTIPVWYVDASIRKDLWNRKGSITLNIQDIFRSRKTGSHTESLLFVQDSWRRRDAQLVRLNFSYRFGKFDVSLFRRKNNRVETEGMEGGF
ncbi:MAG: TonB-dependent receptor [Saprospiraceae bacterium]|nr:TonB-dependent receptor [Saprospiraceae bacterium]